MSPPHPLDKLELHDRVRRIAKKMRCRLPKPQSDLDEVTQQLFTGVVERWHGFDESRGTPEAFVTVAAWSAARSLIRDSRRAKRDPKRTRQMGDALEGALKANTPSPQASVGNAEVMARALGRLDPADAQVALYIMHLGVNHARKRLGLDRSQWVQIRQRLRLALIEENLGNCSTKSRRRARDGVSSK
jgi:DNA-directed RNA polymerase specialized sigma24 family protein